MWVGWCGLFIVWILYRSIRLLLWLVVSKAVYCLIYMGFTQNYFVTDIAQFCYFFRFLLVFCLQCKMCFVSYLEQNFVI